MTLVINEDLKRRMSKHRSIRWSAVVRNIIEQKLRAFSEVDRIAKKSRFTLKHWAGISKRIDASIAKRAEELLNESNS